MEFQQIKECERDTVLFNNGDWWRFITRNNDNIQHARDFLFYAGMLIHSEIKRMGEQELDLSSEEADVFERGLWGRSDENTSVIHESLVKTMLRALNNTKEKKMSEEDFKNFLQDKKGYISYIERLVAERHQISDEEWSLLEMDMDENYNQLKKEDKEQCLLEYKLTKIPAIDFIKKNITKIFGYIKKRYPEFFKDHNPQPVEWNYDSPVGMLIEKIHKFKNQGYTSQRGVNEV